MAISTNDFALHDFFNNCFARQMPALRLGHIELFVAAYMVKVHAVRRQLTFTVETGNIFEPINKST